MERTLISFNLPNMITVPLMAFIAFAVVGLIVQGMKRAGVMPGGDNGDGSQS